jgi:hypothetical protein
MEYLGDLRFWHVTETFASQIFAFPLTSHLYPEIDEAGGWGYLIPDCSQRVAQAKGSWPQN